jgi:hypothetical protein
MKFLKCVPIKLKNIKNRDIDYRKRQGRQCTYNVILRHDPANIVAAEKQ